MAKFIIEVIHPLRFLREYKTFEGPEVRIGRGYGNDLILEDPHVSAQHLIVRSGSAIGGPRHEPGGRRLQGRRRGKGESVRTIFSVVEQARLGSGDEIVIGRTRLRFLSPGHPVAATKLLIPTHPFFQRIEKPVNAWSILLVCTMIFTAHVYMTSLEDVSIPKLASGSLGFLFTAFMWAGLWAFAGRMIKHKTQFAAQLSLSLLFLVTGLMFINISEYLGYSFNNVIAEVVSVGILLGGLGTAFLVGNMTLATNVSLRKRIAVCSSIFLGIIAILTLLYYSFKDEFNPNPMYFATLKPPFARILLPAGKLSANRSVDQFLTQTAGIFDFSDKLKGTTAK